MPAETSLVVCKLASGGVGGDAGVSSLGPHTRASATLAWLHLVQRVRWAVGCPRARTMTSTYLAFPPQVTRFGRSDVPALPVLKHRARVDAVSTRTRLQLCRWVHIAMSGALARHHCETGRRTLALAQVRCTQVRCLPCYCIALCAEGLVCAPVSTTACPDPSTP